MKKQKNKKEKIVYPDISNVASSSECTGLMPNIPQNDDEYDSYQEMYDMEIPKKD